MKFDFWYDFSSPFAYLGSTQIEKVAKRSQAELTWCPMLLGAVFKAVGSPNVPLFEMPEAKRAYLAKDIKYWASYWQVPMVWPSRFPMNTVKALRLVLAADGNVDALRHALFKAFWVEDRDISSDEVLGEILQDCSMDAGLVAATQEPAIKDRLKQSTGAAVEAGVFGAPTSVVHHPKGDFLFWGQDRLHMVEEALKGWEPPA